MEEEPRISKLLLYDAGFEIFFGGSGGEIAGRIAAGGVNGGECFGELLDERLGVLLAY